MIHAVCLLLFSLAPALAQEPQAPPKPVEAVKCPVTGSPANLAISAPTKEGPVFFCTADCITRYRAEPDKFSEALARQRKALAQRPRVQVKCPVSGDPPPPRHRCPPGDFSRPGPARIGARSRRISRRRDPSGAPRPGGVPREAS